MNAYQPSTTTWTELGQQISEWFWSPYFWLPDGLTWKDLESRTDINYANPKDIWIYPFIIAALWILFRIYIFYPYVGGPLATRFGIKQIKKYPPPPNSDLEKLCSIPGVPIPMKEIETAAKKTGMSVRQVQIWLRQKKKYLKITTHFRFQEVSFNLVYHITITVIAFLVTYSKPWYKHIGLAFEGYPHHSVDDGTWWLYMLSLANYWSSAVWELTHAHGKDVVPMVVHHICSIMLMCFSWTGGLFRMGCLVLLVHEGTDIPLLTGKLCKYIGLEKVTDAIFVLFVMVWFYTRVYLFPFWLLKECFFEMPPVTMSIAVYVQYGCGIFLLILNIAWTILIVRTMIRKVITGDPLKDDRSSDEMSDEGSKEKDKKIN